MQTIEIITAQNVLIEHELASLRDRILSFIIDLFFILISIWGLSIIIALSFPSVIETYLFLVAIPLFFFYSLAFEYFNRGQSPGKKIMGIKVVKLNGIEPSLGDFAARWSFRLIDIYFSLGAVAALLINSSAKHQRIGDIVANTTVISIRLSQKLSLNELLRINSLDSYSPKYTDVRKLRESDVLLIKNTLDRFHLYKNEAHEQAVDKMAKKLKELLHIADEKQTNEEFLKTVINDYIVLTR